MSHYLPRGNKIIQLQKESYRKSLSHFMASSGMQTNKSSGRTTRKELKESCDFQSGVSDGSRGSKSNSDTDTWDFPQDSQHTLVIGSNEAQDVLVSQHNRLINFCLTEPGSLISRGEDFHSYIFPTPFSTPDFTKSAFSYNFLQDNSPRDGSLHEQR